MHKQTRQKESFCLPCFELRHYDCLQAHLDRTIVVHDEHAVAVADVDEYCLLLQGSSPFLSFFAM